MQDPGAGRHAARFTQVGEHGALLTRRAELEGHAWHDLRHHHASNLLSAGVSPALLTTYAHIIRNDDERVRAIVDESLGVSAEDWLRTKAVS